MTEHRSPDGQWTWDGSQWVPTTFVYGGTPAPSPPPASTPPPASSEPPAAAAGSPPDALVPRAGAATWGPPPAAPVRDWLAILSLVCALSTPLIGFGPIPAVILGHLARHQARAQGRAPSGFATAGLVIGYTLIALGILVIGILLLALRDFTF